MRPASARAGWLSSTISLRYLGRGRDDWAALVAEHAALSFEPVLADHPLWVLYTSGTTGRPKPIVHGHAGIAIEHLKVLGLHFDLGPADRFFWYTTTGWMMWNFLVSGLMTGAGVVLFDGDPATPDLRTLWRVAAQERCTVAGFGAPFIVGSRKARLRPGDELDLTSLRAVGSTGAPLPASSFGWLVDAVSKSAQPCPVSGGTDVCSSLVGTVPTLPVRAGEMTAPHLGCAVRCAGPAGDELPPGVEGELVVTRPMPSMPLGFWGDSTGERYQSAYFEVFPGMWRHGDWITIHADGGCVIRGRSDATMNRGGVRLGTSDVYDCVESFPEVADSLVVHLESDDGDGMGRLLLFVALAPGTGLDDDLRARIRTRLRGDLSPRHVPDEIVEVPGIPRTHSGKKLEVPVKRILKGASTDSVAARDALANPEALTVFASLAARLDGADR